METVVRRICVIFIYMSCAYAASTMMVGNVPVTRFSCQGRPTGYYADVDSGCQFYHMCDELGRKFSFACPNTTLFQQRMMVCDHWYMVNCSKAESDYDANLLIGQRDKHFVSADAQASRTPRPDILIVPYTSNYYEGLKHAESKYPYHTDNSLEESQPSRQGKNKNTYVSLTKQTSASNYNNHNQYTESTPRYSSVNRGQQTYSTNQGRNFQNGITPSQNYPSSVSSTQYTESSSPKYEASQYGQSNGISNNNQQYDKQNRQANSRSYDKSYGKTTSNYNQQAQSLDRHDTESFDDNQRGQPLTQDKKSADSFRASAGSEEFQIDLRMGPQNVDVQKNQFINRFDPTDTSMNQKEITNINNQLSGFENKHARNNDNTKSQGEDNSHFNSNEFLGSVKAPSRELQPPKFEHPILPSTTMGPPIYYEWKWAAPAFDLEPPKEDSKHVDKTSVPDDSDKFVKIPVIKQTTPTRVPSTTTGEEYKFSSYYVPDYIFPLDNEHPGYDGEKTSFLTSPKGYGENPACPQCHPAFLKPGTCEPCIERPMKDD